MVNLLEETKKVLKEHGKTINDIKFIRGDAFNIPIGDFLLAADEEYDNGFGGTKVAEDLLIVGDNWWLERGEYDGREWWEFKTLPASLDCEKSIKHVMGSGWRGVAGMNKEV